MTIDELIDIQEQGGRARVLGLKLHDNPFLRNTQSSVGNKSALSDWLVCHDAWKFGWEAEDASRDAGVAAKFEMLAAGARSQRYSKYASITPVPSDA